MTMYPFPSASYSASESTGGARGLGPGIQSALCPPRARDFPVQWADPGVKPAINPPIAPFGPALVSVFPRFVTYLLTRVDMWMGT